MSEKWTLGPWEVAYLDQHNQRIVKNENIEICTCWHHSVGAIEAEMEHNARLIAAAPDLADIAARAQYLANTRGGDYFSLTKHELCSIMVELDEALSKARGEETFCIDCGVNPADPPSKLCPGCEAYSEHTGAL